MSGIGLLAEAVTGQDRLESLHHYFENVHPRAGGNEFLSVVVLVVAVVALVAWLSRWLLPQTTTKNRPWRLFFALCRRHRLSWRQRWLLWQLARTRSPQMPARVFLDPELFELNPPPNPLTRKAILLEELRTRLFGQPPLVKKSFPSQKQQSEWASEN
ncbi:MAG: hypothetical protein NZ602_05640 [Thermoguttaceae bacterium]|nr:hypothetical protein [Thermoguttaceae bacterium]MDW8037933.1 hypothetical protein [Thermoguttaceae bacterium]